MDVHDQKISEILTGDVQFIIPLFQRQYEWNCANWRTLWEDIVSTYQSQDALHFFGAMVCQRIETGENFNKFILIDGQQRLTTISVILMVLRDLANRNRLQDLGSKINMDYLVNIDADGQSRARMLLSSDGDDRKQYESMLHSDNILQNASSHNLAAAYVFFKKRIHQAIISKSMDLTALWKKIASKFTAIRITVRAEDNPYKIFEGLNAKGKSLTQADLIRNFFFMQLPEKSAEHSHQQYWQPMQNRLGSELTEFMRHFLIAEKETFIRKSDVYEKMRLFCRTQDTIHATLVKLSAFSAHYEKVLQPIKEPNTRIRICLDRLNQLEYTIAYPFLLQLYEQYTAGQLSENEIVDTLSALENFHIRRMVCNLPTNHLNKIFSKLYTEVRKELASSSQNNFSFAVKRVLCKKDYPNDTAFAEAFQRFFFYKTTGSNKVCRLILKTLESGYVNKESVDTSNPIITIEHVMPQTITDAWKRELGDQWEFTHSQYLHTIGNLTLTGYNTELGNLPYRKKLEKLRDSNLRLNRYFRNIPQWTEASIRERAEVLTNMAMDIWHYFGSVATN